MKRKSGFTIAEVVISIAVIAIVSLTATFVILSGIRIQKNTRDKFYAVNLCENAVELFQAAVDNPENGGAEGVFKTVQSNMNALLGIQPELDSTGSLSARAILDENWQSTKDTEKEAYRCVLTLEAADGAGLKFTVKVTDSDDAVLYTMSYVSLSGGGV